jgi:DNA-binding winged helix-turn-helix (wHTH) protein
MRIRFGNCVLDRGTRELRKRGRVVDLSPKAYRLLEVLLERRPEAVGKEELQDLLWPGVFVAEGNLARLINEVRKASGDDAGKPRFVRTVHGFGYAFSGPAEADTETQERGSTPDVVYKLVWDEREIALKEGENILGRDRDAVAWIDIPSVSRHHARIVISGTRATLEDLGSKNGTYVKGQRVTTPRPLRDGDSLLIGSAEMEFRQYQGGVPTRTTRAAERTRRSE